MMNSKFHTKEANEILKNSISSSTFSVFDFFLINPNLTNKVQLHKHVLNDDTVVFELLDHACLEQKSVVTDDFIPLVLVDENHDVILETIWNDEKLKKN